VSWRYLTGVLEVFDEGVLEIFDRCPGDISSVSWRYLTGVLEVFDECLGDISSFS